MGMSPVISEMGGAVGSSGGGTEGSSEVGFRDRVGPDEGIIITSGAEASKG